MFAKTKKRAVLGLAVVATVLAGCTTTKIASDTHQSNVNRSSQGLERMGARPSIRPGGAQLNDGIFVAAARQQQNPGANLPSRVQSANAVTLESRDPMTLGQVVARLTEITGLPHVAALGPTGLAAPTVNDAASSPDMMMGAAANAATPASSASSRVVGPAPTRNEVTMTPSLKGPLSGVLDEVAAFFDAEWSFDDGRVVFRDYVTRQYQVVALPGDSSGSSSVGSGAMSASSSMEVSFWGDIEAAMKGVAGEGANISMGKGTGIVTVTARVNDHPRIAEYVQKVNASVGQQITFDVNVLTVSQNDNDNYGFDVGAAFSNLGNLNIDFQSAAANGTGGGVNIGFLDANIDFSAIVNALSTQGRVSVDTRTGVTTSNNRIAPVEVVRKQSYASQVETTVLPNGGGTSTAVTPAELTTGFSMQLFPRILNNREIMVQYSIDISELNGFRTFTSQSGSVELPDTSQTTFEQQAMLSNGQTLVLAGFERMRVNVDEAGIGKSNFFGLGGRTKAETERVATVVMITPRLITRQGSVYASSAR